MNYFQKILKHKIILTIVLITIVGIGYYTYKTFFIGTDPIKYITTTVQKGSIIVSVSGSGQVSSSNQIDLKPKASGDILTLNIVQGQAIKTGAIVAQINASDAYKNVRDAKSNLETAKLSLEKIMAPNDNLTLIQAENALINAQQAKEKAEDDLKNSYDDAFNTISNAFLDLPSVTSGIRNVLKGNSYDQYQLNIDYYYNSIKNFDDKALTYRNDADTSLETAQIAYDNNFINYKNTSRYADPETIITLLAETYKTTKAIAESVKATDNYLSFVKDQTAQNKINIPSQLTAHQANLASYLGLINGHIGKLLTIENTIKNSKLTIISSERTITEKTESLNKVKNGADALDIKSAQLAVVQRQNSLADAQQALADYTLRAPFDGTIAVVNVKKGDTISAGTNVATLITDQKIAEITLNEVDVAKVKIDQKATLTFDAVENLNITGKVVQIDTLGTVSQGVVNYIVKIGFDTQDERIKPGMSVSAAIITEIKQDILVIPNGALKSDSLGSYVEMFVPPLANSENNQGSPSAVAPLEQTIEVGITNDSLTEIISGLNEGDQIVLRTVSSAASTNTGNTGFGIPGLTGGNTRSATGNSAIRGAVGR